MPFMKSGLGRGKTLLVDVKIFHGQWFINAGKVYSVCGVDEAKIQLVIVEPPILTGKAAARTITVSRTRLAQVFWPVPCPRCGKSHGEMRKLYDCKGCGARLCGDQVDATHSGRLYHRVWSKNYVAHVDDFYIRNYKECGRIVTVQS